MTVDLVIFIVSAVVAVFGATMMIAQRNPVASVLYMILSLVAQAVCYIQLSALFLGAILVVVYAGAIMVLFLFVIMLLNLRGDDEIDKPANPLTRFTKYIFGVLLTLEMVFVVKAVQFPSVATGMMGESSEFGTVEQVAQTMFTDFVYPFELTGILLLVAVVGAVVIAKRKHDDVPTEESPEAGDGGER